MPAIKTSEAPAGNRRHDGKRVALFHSRLVLLEIANVFVVQIQVHEGAQLAFVAVQVLPQVRIGRSQYVQGLSDRGGLHIDRALLPGILAQWCWDQYFHCLTSDAWLLARDSYEYSERSCKSKLC